jgi:hypothetical protein
MTEAYAPGNTDQLKTLDEPYVFVSYSRDDAEYVHRLLDHLETNGIATWYDDLIPEGERWRVTLQERIERCGVLLLIESPNAQKSLWVDDEFLFAGARDRPRLILVLDGALRLGTAGIQSTYVTDGSMPGQRFMDRLSQLLYSA